MARRCWQVLAGTFTLAVTAVAAAERPSADQPVIISLQAGARNKGEVGSASMSAQDGNTAITLTLSGVPPSTARPVRLYTFIYSGTCAKHDDKPTFALNQSVQAEFSSRSGMVGPFVFRKLAPAPLEELRSGSFAIIVRTSPADGNDDIYCGDLK